MESTSKRTYPLYLRDLSEQEKATFIDEWQTRGMKKFLKAVEDGDDITVGEIWEALDAVVE